MFCVLLFFSKDRIFVSHHCSFKGLMLQETILCKIRLCQCDYWACQSGLFPGPTCKGHTNKSSLVIEHGSVLPITKTVIMLCSVNIGTSVMLRSQREP